jgi:protein-S-isoprenylcysteine O-methyltransferase Ste14
MRSTTQAAAGSAAFFVAGPVLEAGAGPYVLVAVAGSDLGSWPVALRILGVLLIAAGVVVLLDVFVRFAREGRGTPSPAAPTEKLLVGGAYRVLRHPMYVATATIIAGEALAFAQPILLLAAAAYATAMATLVVAIEEPRLARRFGVTYDAYRQTVPGWLPRRRP